MGACWYMRRGCALDPLYVLYVHNCYVESLVEATIHIVPWPCNPFVFLAVRVAAVGNENDENKPPISCQRHRGVIITAPRKPWKKVTERLVARSVR